MFTNVPSFSNTLHMSPTLKPRLGHSYCTLETEPHSDTPGCLQFSRIWNRDTPFTESLLLCIGSLKTFLHVYTEFELVYVYCSWYHCLTFVVCIQDGGTLCRMVSRSLFGTSNSCFYSSFRQWKQANCKAEETSSGGSHIQSIHL
jgi:hypothetical protein